MMNIEFFVPDDETIPTRLRLRVDGPIDVYYESLPNDFAYKFTFFKWQDVTLEMACAITDKIVSRMISQSYDHGAQWRERGVRSIVNDEFELSITVFFRVRDAG